MPRYRLRISRTVQQIAELEIVAKSRTDAIFVAGGMPTETLAFQDAGAVRGKIEVVLLGPKKREGELPIPEPIVEISGPAEAELIEMPDFLIRDSVPA